MVRRALVVILVVASSLVAAPIPIVNPSFELDVIGAVGGNLGTTPSGWTGLGPGVYRPPASSFNSPVPGSSLDGANNLPDGLQTSYSNFGQLGQVLTTAVIPGLDYTLSVWVGDRWDLSLPSYTVQLLAGGNVLASTTDPVAPGNGQFAEVTLTYTATGSDSGLLEIRLINNGGAQINWDDVTLDGSLPAAVPEPGSLMLMVGGLAGVVLFRRRR